MDAIMHGNSEPAKTGPAEVAQTKLVGQSSAETRNSRVIEQSTNSKQSSKRAESQRQESRQLTSSNILTWDNPYLGNFFLTKNETIWSKSETKRATPRKHQSGPSESRAKKMTEKKMTWLSLKSG